MPTNSDQQTDRTTKFKPQQQHISSSLVESSQNVMADCDGRTGGEGGNEGETGEWSGYPVPFTLPRNMVYPALLPLMLTTLLPVVD